MSAAPVASASPCPVFCLGHGEHDSDTCHTSATRRLPGGLEAGVSVVDGGAFVDLYGGTAQSVTPTQARELATALLELAALAESAVTA